jgi:hypothetical protein
MKTVDDDVAVITINIHTYNKTKTETKRGTKKPIPTTEYTTKIDLNT